jgi:hypothetical protein
MHLKSLIYKFLFGVFSWSLFFPILMSAVIARLFLNQSYAPRLVWGSTPIINNSYWSRAMAAGGFKSETYTENFYSSINKREDWDRVLLEEYSFLPYSLRPFLAFVHSLFRYDVFFLPFTGFFIGHTPLNKFQALFLKVAGKRIVVIPYGADSYVYGRIRSTETIHGLLISYPLAAKNQIRIASNVDYWISKADAVIPGVMGLDGFGRWDVLAPSSLTLDLSVWRRSVRLSNADGSKKAVIVAHAPNHRGFKGTEFILNAVKQLQNEGLKVELRLLENMQNTEVKRILVEEVDILVEQLIFTGHGLNGLEGMACGLPTVSNLEADIYLTPMRRWSFFGECPLVSASPETVQDVLRKLITRPQLRHELGGAGCAYVEKYHGFDSAQYLFSNVIDYVYGKKDSLINLYHPLLGEYPNRSPKIQHPLVNNRIVD